MNEICIVAAMRTPTGLVLRGQRHSDCIKALKQIESLTYFEIIKAEQGFITSKNRFVGRKEGYELQKKAKVKSQREGGYTEGRLYSEDLY